MVGAHKLVALLVCAAAAAQTPTVLHEWSTKLRLEDLSERRNLAEKLPKKAKQLQQRLARWRADTGAVMPTLRDSQ